MCCCDKPTINGELGYKWQPNDVPIVRQLFSPDLREGEILLYDEPGRCGGLDSHSHHYRLVLSPGGSLELLVRHGGGEDRVSLSTKKTLLSTFAALDSTARYWMLNGIYHAYRDGEHRGSEKTHDYWQTAAKEGRIKTRKVRGQNAVKVTVAPKIIQIAS